MNETLTTIRGALRATPLVSFVCRYWFLLIVAVAAWFLPGWQSGFDAVGMLVYVPGAALSVASTALLCRHLVNRNTTDKYRVSGAMARDWKALPAHQKIWIFKIELWVWIMALAIVASAVFG